MVNSYGPPMSCLEFLTTWLIFYLDYSETCSPLPKGGGGYRLTRRIFLVWDSITMNVIFTEKQNELLARLCVVHAYRGEGAKMIQAEKCHHVSLHTIRDILHFSLKLYTLVESVSEEKECGTEQFFQQSITCML